MTTIPNFNTEKVYTGLDTYQYTVQTSAMHVASIRIDKMPSSAMTVSIVQAGSVNATLATMTVVPPPSADSPQTSQSLRVLANCAASDTLSFVLTSSAPADNTPNGFKAIMNIHISSSGNT